MAINKKSNLGRSYGRDFAATPFFKWQNSNSISSSSKTGIDWEYYNTASKKYLPFNQTVVINNGEEDIIFYPNKDESNPIFISKGTSQVLNEFDLPALRSFIIENVGSGSISANKIIVTNNRKAQTTDSIVGRIHQRLFGGL